MSLNEKDQLKIRLENNREKIKGKKVSDYEDKTCVPIPQSNQSNENLAALLIVQLIVLYYGYKKYSEEFAIAIGHGLNLSKRKERKMMETAYENLTWWDYTSLVLWIFFYLLIAGCSYYFANINQYLDNSHSVNEIDSCFKKMKQPKIRIKFTIRCYHMIRRDGKERKKYTHKAIKYIRLAKCSDISGHLMGEFYREVAKKRLTLIKYKPTFQFRLEEEQELFQNIKKQFIQANNKDKQYSFEMDVRFEYSHVPDHQAFITAGTAFQYKAILLLSSIFCMAWLFVTIIDKYIAQRYEIPILKLIKLHKQQEETVVFK